MRLLPRLLVLLALIAAGYVGYKHFFGASPAGEAPQGGPMGAGGTPVGVAVVEPRQVRQWQEFSGRLVAVESAQIRPRVAGTIEKIHFNEGQWVEKGALLFTIDQRQYSANLQAAQARATLAEAELARAKSLIADKAIPQRELDQRRNDAEIAKAELTRAKLDYDYSLIRAPISGRLSRAEITEGNLVDAGGNAPVLTSIVSSKPIYADVDVDEQTFLTYIQRAGNDSSKLAQVPVQLGLGNDTQTPYSGRIQSFDNQLNPASGTIRVRAVFDNEEGALVPGLFARVRIGDAVEAPALLITERAIGTDQNKKFVMVVKPDNSTERREITLGGMAEGMRIVQSGLQPGEKIVISGLQRLMIPGQPVTPEMMNMDGTPLQGGDSGLGIGDSDKTPEAPPTTPSEQPPAAEEK
jgi:multidrug efflux system membrane fusion protein